MIIVSAISQIIFLSLTSSVLRYFRLNKTATKFAFSSFFAGLWSLGSISYIYDVRFIALLPEITFLIPPTLTSFLLLEYLTDIASNNYILIKFANRIYFPIQLVITLVLMLNDLQLTGLSYITYCAYYLFVFMSAYLIYERVRRLEVKEQPGITNLYSIVLAAAVITITNIIFPFLGIVELIWIGPASSLIPLYSHIVSIQRYKLFNLNFSFLLHLYSELIQNFLAYLGFMLLLGAVFSNYSVSHISIIITIGLYFLAVLSYVAKLLTSVGTGKYYDWGSDIRNTAQYMTKMIDESNTLSELKNVSLQAINSSGIETCCFVIYDEPVEFNGRMLQYGNPKSVLLGMDGYCYAELNLAHEIHELSDNERIILHFFQHVITLKLILLKNSITFSERIFKLSKDFHLKEVELKEKNEAKDDFISMTSHQLRTPLSITMFNIKMLMGGAHGSVSAKQASALRDAQEGIDRMGEVIEELLDVARLNDGTFTIQKKAVNVSDLVRSEVDSLRTKAREKKIKIEADIDDNIILMLDQIKAKQVVANFLDNALAYTSAGGRIMVNLEAGKDRVIFTVRDTGIGISKSEQLKLFGKFVRASNAQRLRPNGTGLGLYISKKIIEAHGGSIIFSSTLNKGSTFGFSLAP